MLPKQRCLRCAASIFYCLSVARCFLRRIFSASCRLSSARQLECAVWSALWRRTPPIPPRHVECAASLWFSLSASWKRRPTINGQCSDCPDSRTCSQCSFFTFVSGHVSLTLPLRTLQLSWRSYVGLQRIRTFCCMGVRSVS